LSRASEASREASVGSHLIERLRGCLQFAVRTLETSDRSHSLWDVQLGEVTGFDKLVLEAALFAMLVNRSGRCPDEVRSLIALVRRNCDAETVLATLRRQPAQLTALATVLVVLDQFERASEAEREGLATALSSPYVESCERVPFRLLDRQWVLHLAGHGPLVEPHALATSAACRTMHPIYMSREDAYAITHTLMYVTDFGAALPPAELIGLGLAETIDACLAWCLYERDYDLVAELLLAQVLLGGKFSEYGEVAWQDCVATWDDFGFLPSPSLSAESFVAVADEHERTQYAYHHMYHTVFVAGLLCNALLGVGLKRDARAGRASPTAMSWPSGVREREDVCAAISSAHGFLARTFDLDARQAAELVRDIRWQADDSIIDKLVSRWSRDPIRPDVVERMARDAAVIRTARSYDLAGLAATLRSAVLGGRLSPTVMAGAGFLARQVRSGGILADQASDAASRARSAGVSAALAGCLATVEKCWPAWNPGEGDDG
jgi:hypothetical protein